MVDNDQTGPWVLALGALAIGVGAAAKVLRRQRTDGEDTTRRSDGE